MSMCYERLQQVGLLVLLGTSDDVSLLLSGRCMELCAFTFISGGKERREGEGRERGEGGRKERRRAGDEEERGMEGGGRGEGDGERERRREEGGERERGREKKG